MRVLTLWIARLAARASGCWVRIPPRARTGTPWPP